MKVKAEKSNFTGVRSEKTWSNLGRKALGILRIGDKELTKQYLIDGYHVSRALYETLMDPSIDGHPVSRQLYETLTEPSYARAHPMSTSFRLEEFKGIEIDELNNKLIYFAGIFHVKDAYDLLLQRTGATDEWVTQVAYRKYGDLIFQD